MLRKTHILALALWLWAAGSPAHPVTFKGGYAFTALNQPDMLDWQMLYTFHPKLSVGADFIRDTMETEPRYFLIPRISWLVKRWNETASQSNVYVYGGVGIAKKNAIWEPAGELAVEADHETQAIYFSGKAMAVAARGFQTLALYQARVGFAPYVGETNELHSWVLGQVQYLPFAGNQSLRVGPVLRQFYKTVLWEIGVTTEGSWNLNFMVHW